MKTRTSLKNIPGTDFAIGDRVREAVCGFEGIVRSHTRHITGCDTVWIETEDPKADKDSREKWADILRVELIKKNPLDIREITSEVPASG